jgi:hypothetical protein
LSTGENGQSKGHYLGEMITPLFPAVELIEAAARSGRGDMAADVLGRLAEITPATGTDGRSASKLVHGHC